jgi:hypothetical protein
MNLDAALDDLLAGPGHARYVGKLDPAEKAMREFKERYKGE